MRRLTSFGLAVVLAGNAWAIPVEEDLNAWTVGQLRRLVAWECAEVVEPVAADPCLSPTSAEDFMFCAPAPELEPAVEEKADCFWLDTSDTEQVLDYTGTIFINRELAGNMPTEVYIAANVTTADFTYTYTYAFDIDPESFDIRHLLTNSEDAPRLFFTEYNPAVDNPRLKFNLDVGEGQVIYFNFWPLGSEVGD